MEKIFAVVGASASGKDTLVSMVSEELCMPVATSFTTRPMRSGEKDGREYIFISEEEFIQKEAMSEIAECTSYNNVDNQTWWYGLTKEELEKGRYVLAIVNPDGLKQLTDLYGEKVVSILIQCDGKERLRRAIDRDEKANPNEICRRFLSDSRDFEGLIFDYSVDTTSKNGEVSLLNSYNKFKKIILTEIMEEKKYDNHQ